MPANQTHDREAARTRIFDGAQTLAAALMKCDRSERWEPLRDLILAGLGPSVGVERKRVVPVPLLPEGLAQRERLELYELRHACATLLMERGLPPHVVANQLGHTDGGALVQRLRGVAAVRARLPGRLAA